MATYASDWRRWHYEPPGDELFRRCLTVSGAAGALFLLIVLIAPARERAITSVEQLPERFARLILEKPEPAAVAPARIEQPAAPAPRVEAAPAPAAVPTPGRRRRESAAPVDPDAGRAGRERAQQQVAALSRSTASLDQAIGGLTSSLDATPEASPSGAGGGRGRRGRTVRAGRSEGELGSVRADVGGGGATDLGGSAVAGATVAVGSLSGSGSGGGGGGAAGEAAGGGPGGHGTGSAPGVYRSNASLLAVIQKYAPGIQYCYGNELKREAGLRGKLVVAMMVAASGEVTEVAVVQNTTGSQRLATCALSQIREWRFPAIDGGPTAFQTPFVFTPPD